MPGRGLRESGAGDGGVDLGDDLLDGAHHATAGMIWGDRVEVARVVHPAEAHPASGQQA